ncbi:hypothetical protein CRUP_028011, partial [Coryphaenoides rupestris]
PLDRLALSWKRDGRWLAAGRRLLIAAVTPADSGVYVCEAALGNSTVRPVEARAHLTVMGTPQPRMEWFKDGVPLSKLGNSRYKVAAATGLTVRRVQPEDGGYEGQRGPVYLPRPAEPPKTLHCLEKRAPGVGQWVRADSQVLPAGVRGLKVQPVGFQDAGGVHLHRLQPPGQRQRHRPPSPVCRRYHLKHLQAHLFCAVFKMCFAGIANQLIGCVQTKQSRTLISVPPSDQRVIKGTTATLDCNAQHTPRVDIRHPKPSNMQRRRRRSRSRRRKRRRRRREEERKQQQQQQQQHR